MHKRLAIGVVTGALAAGAVAGVAAGLPALADGSGGSGKSGTSGQHQADGRDRGPGHGSGHGHGPGAGRFAALHGEFTVKDEKGAYVLRDVQSGKVRAVSATSLTVRSDDGTDWTWTLDSGTRVGHGQKIDTIKTGDTVRVEGARSGDVRTAAFVGEPPSGKDGRDGKDGDHGRAGHGSNGDHGDHGDHEDGGQDARPSE
ncbi:DUF5666 domain-containing protein [Actinomadura harenae]|uniref:DUF5666 domain-containing protein n=1 Tax=Actinomadura harenae TaxID=2483351 RepID=A0A3M2LPC4_9ACTN|nr:DUF5666 domain-containing protein [Actinomadura harenae]RMI39182.1 hypothetical protein EBO15_30470 [Actinomadura harenae]